MADVGEVIYTALEVFIAVACCLGNVLVIWAVWVSGALRQPTFCFIASLAVADFLVGALAVPLAVLVDGWVEMSFQGCLFISCVVIVLTQASVYSLLAIAVDRYLRVYIPLKYKGLAKRTHSWAIVAVCWMIASVLGFIPMFGWNNYNHLQPSNSTTIVCQFLTVIPMSYLVNFIFLSCLLPPMIIMTVLYGFIFCTISQQLRGGVIRASKSGAYYVKEKKLASSLALVLALFAACWLPIHIMNTMEFYNQSSLVPHIAFYVGILLSHANSAVNPVVYAFKIPKIKRAYKMAWRKFLPCRREQQTDQMAENYASSITYSTAKSAAGLT
ncbi:adenosine receptor A1-like [Pygocentrus nattereri]|uniref:G-protein coupled receptors family 1 profile domain-containing protein n=1 Tax=Pygocentrus nattereri TaxID=42514 RepID=A0AAR2IVS5_PYGNA|nr:adenosine receptor A1-like [Pygocentrus nattereri]